MGLAAVQESFIVDRVNPTNTRLIAGGREIAGLPLFDGSFTDASGIRGRLGLIGTDAEIAFVEAPPNTAAAGELGEARRQDRYRAIVCATRGGTPGLCPHNADSFLRPYGPPVLQVSSEEASFLNDHAQREETEIALVASIARTKTTAFNVVSTIRSKRPELPPLVVMTPRSGWYWVRERTGRRPCLLARADADAARAPARAGRRLASHRAGTSSAILASTPSWVCDPKSCGQASAGSPISARTLAPPSVQGSRRRRLKRRSAGMPRR